MSQHDLARDEHLYQGAERSHPEHPNKREERRYELV